MCNNLLKYLVLSIIGLYKFYKFISKIFRTYDILLSLQLLKITSEAGIIFITRFIYPLKNACRKNEKIKYYLKKKFICCCNIIMYKNNPQAMKCTMLGHDTSRYLYLPIPVLEYIWKASTAIPLHFW